LRSWFLGSLNRHIYYLLTLEKTYPLGMTTNIEWRVQSMRRYNEDGVVFHVSYALVASSEEHEAVFYSTRDLEAPAPGAQVIPYEDLTEEIVVGWLRGSVDQQEADRAERILEARLRAHQETSTGLPWRGN